MGKDQYLIPANSKKSMLFLNFFNQVDLIVFGIGVGMTFIFILSFKEYDMSGALLMVLPALISLFLVVPIPYHHNVRILIINIYDYFSQRRTYFWKGWCVTHEKTEN